MITLLHLFLAFLKIGAFSFGGGYAAMPLIQSEVVDTYAWMTPRDFSDLVTISQMTPGPIAINAATFVGLNVAGVPGALVATLGNILPSCIFVSILAWLYTRYRRLTLLQGILKNLRPAVIAMILAAGLLILVPALFTSGQISFADGNFRIRIFLLFAAAMVLLRKFKWDPILVMVLCGIAEVLCRFVTSLL